MGKLNVWEIANAHFIGDRLMFKNLYQDKSKISPVDLGFPEPNNPITALSEVCVLRPVASSLCKLAGPQGFESGVAVPPFAVDLDNYLRVRQKAINDELGLYQVFGPVEYAYAIKDFIESRLWSARLVPTNSCLTFPKWDDIVRVPFKPLRNLLANFGPPHRIVRLHPFSNKGADEAMACLISIFYMKCRGTRKHLFVGKAKRLSSPLCSLSGIIFCKKLEAFLRPNSFSCCLSAIATKTRFWLSARSISATLWAKLIRLWLMLSGVLSISMDYRLMCQPQAHFISFGSDDIGRYFEMLCYPL